MKRALYTLSAALVMSAFYVVDALAKPATPISLTTALTFIEDTGCAATPASPCTDAGTFVANDAVTSDLLCAQGVAAESYYFPRSGQAFTIAERTLTCPDGSTLRMRVNRVTFTDLTSTTALIGETWKLTGLGSGRFVGFSGSGTMSEVFDFGGPPNHLGGLVTGQLR